MKPNVRQKKTQYKQRQAKPKMNRNQKDILSFFIQIIAIGGIALLIVALQSCGARQKAVKKQSFEVSELQKKDVQTSTVSVNDVTTKNFNQVENTYTLDRNFSNITYDVADTTQPSSVEFQQNKIITRNAKNVNISSSNESLEAQQSETDTTDTTDNSRKTELSNDQSQLETDLSLDNKDLDLKRDAAVKTWQIIVGLALSFVVIFIVLNRKTLINWAINALKKLFV